jgi:ankyrin repeat protein
VFAADNQAAQAGCDVNAVDRWGRRPMHYAAEAGHLGCIRRLIILGADPNALTGPSTLQHPGSSSSCRSDVSGLSPLMVAARRGRVEAVKLLLKSGAKATLTNSCGETALHHAAGCTIHPEECINVLFAGGLKTSALLNAQVKILPFIVVDIRESIRLEF